MIATAQEPIADAVNSQTTNALIPALSLSVPLSDSVDVNLTVGYGFGLRAKAIIAEIPFKLNKYLTVAPSYVYIASPVMNRRYHENQVRFSVQFGLPIGKGTLVDRSMFERRFRAGFDDSTRYHNRLRFKYPLKIKNFDFSLVAADEVTYDGKLSRWERNRISIGFNKTVNKRLTAEITYLRQQNRRGGDANIVLIAVIVRTEKLSKWVR
ncbi:MAG: DUF2490 domain-containing protein [Actinomycetota bacterium]